jgi:hypothetical protein
LTGCSPETKRRQTVKGFGGRRHTQHPIKRSQIIPQERSKPICPDGVNWTGCRKQL